MTNMHSQRPAHVERDREWGRAPDFAAVIEKIGVRAGCGNTCTSDARGAARTLQQPTTNLTLSNQIPPRTRRELVADRRGIPRDMPRQRPIQVRCSVARQAAGGSGLRATGRTHNLDVEHLDDLNTQ